MSNPVDIAVRLNPDEAEIFSVWQEYCHEIFLEEGKKLDPIGDALPLLVITISRLRPELSEDERLELSKGIWLEFHRAISLVLNEAAGDC